MIRYLLQKLVTLAVLMGASVFTSTGYADTIASPTGPVVLKVSGNISNTNSGDLAELDLETLQTLPKTEITTSTIWTEGEQTFTGVELGVLLEHLGARTGDIRAIAVNEYAADLPWSDTSEGYALIAYERNGQPMSVRSKGPLWIVFDYDGASQFRTEVYYSRSVWQLDQLVVQR